MPVWHPIALVALMLLVSAAGHLLSVRHDDVVAVRDERIARAYLPLLLVNWGLLLYVCRVGRPRFVFAALVGERPRTLGRALGDVALALFATSVLIGGELGWRLAFGQARNPAAEALLPSTALERAIWCVVASSVGVSEEIVYRGYLQRELGRWTASSAGGVLGQAVLFALAHGEQGAAAMFRFFVYAIGLGLLALWRGSLVSGIAAHVAVDLIAGISH